MGHPGPVRRLLRRQGQGLLQGGRARRDDQAGRPGRRARAGAGRRRRRRRRRLDAGRARRAREGRADGQYRPAVQALGHGDDLPRRHRHQDPGRPQGPHARRLVLRQRISVPELDGQARPQDRRLARRRQGAEAGLQRRPAAAEAGRLHLDHDLQRILAGDRRRLQAGAARRVQIRGPGRGDPRGRPLRDGGQAQGPGVRRQDGALRQGVDEGLGTMRARMATKRSRSCSTTTRPAPRPSTIRRRC